MKLYYNTVSPTLLSILTKLMQNEAFHQFRLVGGTALSLQLGHRISVDIDLFTDMDYGTMDLSGIANAFKEDYPYVDGLEKLKTSAPGYTLYCGNSEADAIKVDLFYTDPFLYPPIVDGELRIADFKDIAAMKILAVSNASRAKDYWDIHELMNHITLNEMIHLAIKRFPYSIEQPEVIKKLVNIPTTLEEPNIISLKGDYWEFVVEDIQEEALKMNIN